MAKANFKNNIIILFISLFLYVVALNAKEIGNSTTDSMLWPKLVLLLMIVLSFSSMIGATIQRKKERTEQKEQVGEQPLKKEKIKGIIPITTVFLYVLVMQFIGFFLATFIAIPVFMKMIGEKKITTILVTSFLFVLFVWGVFVKLALLMFPLGIGIFRVFSQFIMFGS